MRESLITDFNLVLSIDDQSVGVGHQPATGQSAIVVDSTVYTFGGFNTRAFSNIQKLTLPVDSCSFLTDKSSCLALIGCDWCENENRTFNGVCYDVDKAHLYSCNNSASNNTLRCNKAALEKRDCRTLLSCYSCFATFPGTSGSHCHWCQLEGCRHSDSNCAHSSRIEQIQCLDYKCEASTCEECTYDSDCMWTRYFQYISETSRRYNRISPAFDWNCFRKSIQTGGKYPANDIGECPALCSSYKTCHSCLGSTGRQNFAFYPPFCQFFTFIQNPALELKYLDILFYLESTDFILERTHDTWKAFSHLHCRTH